MTDAARHFHGWLCFHSGDDTDLLWDDIARLRRINAEMYRHLPFDRQAMVGLLEALEADGMARSELVGGRQLWFYKAGKAKAPQGSLFT